MELYPQELWHQVHLKLLFLVAIFVKQEILNVSTAL